MKRKLQIALAFVAGLIVFGAIGFKILAPNSRPRALAGPVDIARMAAASHAYLGVELETATPGEVAVERVFPGTGAERSGLQAGDVLITVEGHPVSSVADVQQRVADKKAGEVIALTVRRGDEEQRLAVTLIGVTEMDAARAEYLGR